MKKINENDLKKINGGFSVTKVVLISALAAFIVGVIEGIVYPKSCGGE